MIYFSTNLRILRKNNDMSQEDLADVLQYSFRNISKWENGQSIPQYDILLEISKLFNISVDELMEVDLSKKNINKYKSDLLQNKNLNIDFQRELYKFLYEDNSIIKKRVILFYEDKLVFDNYDFPQKYLIILKKEKSSFEKIRYILNSVLKQLQLNGYLIFYELNVIDNCLEIIYQ